MKTLITFVALLFGMVVNAQTVLKTDSVYITGKASNFSTAKANFVNIIVNDLVSGKQITYSANINSNGAYRLTFLKTGTQDVILQFNSARVLLLVSPGDHLTVNFDVLQFEHSLAFSGDNAQTNRDLKAYQSAYAADPVLAYGGDLKTRDKATAASETSNWPDAHKKFLKERYDKESAFLGQYLKTHTLSLVFVSWAKTDLKYEYLKNLTRYPWMHMQYNNLSANQFSISEGYYEFMNDSDLNDINATISSNYDPYLSEYINRFNIRNIGIASKMIDVAVTVYLREPKGIKRDIMLSRFMYKFIEQGYVEKLAPFVNKYTSAIDQPAIKSSIVKVYDAKMYQSANYTLAASIRINKRPEAVADSVFNRILNKYPGKVIYVDFWATWCIPCREEMPNSKKLQVVLTGKDVVFVYLAFQSEEKIWKATIADMGLTGEHYLLEDKDFSALRSYFQFSGIPHYILVNKKGSVVDGDAKRPSDARLKPGIEKLIALN
jgi:thiol-disulfide isomerase/thioredoxin